MAGISKATRIARQKARIETFALTPLEKKVALALVNDYTVWGSECTDNYVDYRIKCEFTQRQWVGAMRRLEKKGVISLKVEKHCERYTICDYTLFPKDRI